MEKIIRKKTSEEKDPVCRSLLSLTEEQQETAEKVAGWVELLPPGVVSEIFSRLIKLRRGEWEEDDSYGRLGFHPSRLQTGIK